MTQPRIAPIDPPYSTAAQNAFDGVMPAGVPPLTLFRTLAVNERVLLRVMGGGLLDQGSISMRERELIINRTCARCGSEYEWGVHVAFFGPRVGLTPEEIADTCAADPDASVFEPRERLLLRLVDELHDTSTVSDTLFAELSRAYRPDQLVEMVALVGSYHLIAFTTNAFRLPLEPFSARFPGRDAPG